MKTNKISVLNLVKDVGKYRNKITKKDILPFVATPILAYIKSEDSFEKINLSEPSLKELHLSNTDITEDLSISEIIEEMPSELPLDITEEVWKSYN